MASRRGNRSRVTVAWMARQRGAALIGVAALFCLRADVMIRQRTGNRFGLEDSLRAILAAGGTIDRDWTIDRVLEVGDRAVGVPVLRELYEQMGSQPVTVDLAALWQQLGIARRGNTVIFDDKAPLAGVRDAILPEEDLLKKRDRLVRLA